MALLLEILAIFLFEALSESCIPCAGNEKRFILLLQEHDKTGLVNTMLSLRMLLKVPSTRKRQYQVPGATTFTSLTPSQKYLSSNMCQAV